MERMASVSDMRTMTLDEIMEFNAAIDYYIEIKNKNSKNANK